MDMQPLEFNENKLEGNPNVVLENGQPPASGSSNFGGRPPLWRRHLLLEFMVGLGLLLLIGGGTALYSATHSSSRSKSTQPTLIVNTQTLDNGTLNKLSVQAGQNGSVQQELTIAAATVFKNTVNVQGAATVQGDLTVNGSSNLLGAVATGGNLAVGGSLTVAHNTSVGGNLSVSGTITAASLNVGSINLSALKLNGDLTFGGHFMPTGTVPTATPSTAVGGGSVKIDGNDTTGSLIITSGSAVAAGEMAIIHFHTPYASSVRVQLTPINANAAQLQYYVTESSGFFTVQTAGAPPANTVFSFNYFVTD